MAGDIFDQVLGIITSFPINIIIIAAVIIFIIYYFWPRKKEEEAFQIEDFRESVYVGIEKILDLFGVNIDAYMTKGIEPLGQISKFYHFTGILTKKDEKDAKKGDKKEENVNLWIFRIGKRSFWTRIFGGGSIDYLVIEDGQLEPYDGQGKRWAVKETVSFLPYGNCYTSSKKAEEWINNISFRRSLEENMTATQNFTRKASYIELKQAKAIERMMSSIESKRLGYDRYKKEVLASGKDIEEDEDED
jgi:hypothetical protein